MSAEQITVPEVVYHYCPLEIFPQIIDSGCLHLTHHSGMNDLTDTRLFFHNLEASARKKKTPENEGRLQEFLNHIQLNLKDYFIGCFSEDPDMLSQWHMYGDRGRGVAIGFWTKSLGVTAQIPIFSDTPERNKGILPVNYINNFQENLADEIIDAYVKGTLAPHQIPVDLFALTHKHMSFSQEKEIRIVDIQDFRINMNPDFAGLRTNFLGTHFDYKVRAHRQIVPYRKHKFTKMPAVVFQLHSIWLGPENRTSPEVIQLLLEKSHMTVNNGIHLSKIPFTL